MVERSWVGWLLGLIPLGLLGWVGWPGVLGLGPRYPQCPNFPVGEEDHPGSEKRTRLIVILWGTIPLMLLNFQRKFCNFFVTILDSIRSSVSILRFRSSCKRLVGEEIGYLTGYPRSIVGVG